MTTLFLAHRIPFPPDRGDKIRSFHIIEHLSRIAPVQLATFADDAADAAHLPALREALGGRLGEAHVQVRRTGKAVAAARALRTNRPVSLTLFDSPAMHAFVRRQLADPGVRAVYAFSGQMAQFVPDPLDQRFVMDFVDVDSAKFADYAAAGRGVMARLLAREARRLLAFERATAARADISLFVSEAEAALFRAQGGVGDIRALGNGIDSAYFDPAATIEPLAAAERGQGPMLLFTGQMDYRPNIEAVRWFATRVLPRVPGARFVIAGRNPPPELQSLASDRVAVTGAVADMRSWLAAADVVVAPLRIARGVQNKVLEAMAMARPVVASPQAFEGIEARADRDLLVADGAEAMAGAVTGLLGDPAQAVTIGAAARRLVTTSYAWNARLAPLAEMIARTPARAAGLDSAAQARAAA